MHLKMQIMFVLLTSKQILNRHTARSTAGHERSTRDTGKKYTQNALPNKRETTKPCSTNSFEKCGIPAIKPQTNARIVGGVEAIPNSWPWQVSLVYKQCGWCHECGASLLYSNWVITAAHCVYNEKASNMRVVLGEHNQRKKEGMEKVAFVSQVILHERYSHATSDNDIALLRLSFAIRFNRYIKPICLPTTDVAVGTHCIITGWGDTRQTRASARLNQVSVPIVNRTQCNVSTWYDGLITDNMICAGYADGRKDACKGDSGGPLVCLTGDDKWTLDGVTSWGEGCARPNSPGVYTRIVKYLTWIKSKTGK